MDILYLTASQLLVLQWAADDDGGPVWARGGPEDRTSQRPEGSAGQPQLHRPRAQHHHRRDEGQDLRHDRGRWAQGGRLFSVLIICYHIQNWLSLCNNPNYRLFFFYSFLFWINIGVWSKCFTVIYLQNFIESVSKCIKTFIWLHLCYLKIKWINVSESVTNTVSFPTCLM